MHYLKSTLPFILAAATLASADTTSTTLADSSVNTACASENILQCIQSMQSNLAICAPDDWNCQCTISTNILDCYNNCPDDISRKDAESTRQQNCANAKAHAPTSTAASATSSSRAAATTSTDIDDGADIFDSEVENNFEGRPIKSYSGLEANSIPRLEEGTGSSLRMGSWLGALALAVGVLL
ncbi:hypothetical protein PEX2_075370 [Penicillium expansum]|uniref:GPI anchored serine-threonine rich protein n=1 Tax=Penicillium expansum TaxID=27334 RepID=A0A0A2JVS2_PENEN|nr:hypothetical protein PEX2_075370 [Penicillium expansum]KGO40805.1 hypothetical protein PEXP_086170 [Penicillium expansum]KGO59557.1 hypothetical protein PEX2_075370 [Penicillium expansum]